MDRDNLLEGPEPPFAVWKAGRAQLGDGRLESNGREHILKIATAGVVIMNIARDDEWNARGLGRALALAQPSFIMRPAMQLGYCVGSIGKDVPPLE